MHIPYVNLKDWRDNHETSTMEVMYRAYRSEFRDIKTIIDNKHENLYGRPLVQSVAERSPVLIVDPMHDNPLWKIKIQRLSSRHIFPLVRCDIHTRSVPTETFSSCSSCYFIVKSGTYPLASDSICVSKSFSEKDTALMLAILHSLGLYEDHMPCILNQFV